MKVLWFSLSPCGSNRRFGNKVYSQSWMTSLEDHLKKVPGIELHVAFISKKERESFNYEGVTYHPVFRSKWNLFQDRISLGHSGYKCYLTRMLQIVGQCSPDIIHIHGTEESFGQIAPYVRNIPIVYSLQGILNPYREKFFSGIPHWQISLYEFLSKKLTLQGVTAYYSKFCHRAECEAEYLKNARYVFGRTQWDYNVAKLFNRSVQYFTVNELLRSPFYDVCWHKTQFSPKIRIISTISGGYYKGFETLLKAVELLVRSQLDFEWHVIGMSEGDEMVHISEKSTGLKSGKCNVRLLGRMNAEQMSAALTEADIYCQVSHIENSPNSLCEAMIVGMPIVASDVGGTSSLLSDGKDGLLVQDGDPYALAGAVLQMSEDFAAAARMAESARSRAAVRHNPEQVISELTNSYRAILS